jgi:ABC-type oligopeptide transport system ATPase subunit
MAVKTNALVDVPTELRRGEILGVVGESGSGKSTLKRSIARLIEPSVGSINLHGVNIAQMGQVPCGRTGVKSGSCFRIRSVRSIPA